MMFYLKIVHGKARKKSKFRGYDVLIRSMGVIDSSFYTVDIIYFLYNLESLLFRNKRCNGSVTSHVLV